MEKAKTISVLRELAAKSPAANDMFHDFAMRERARGSVSLPALYTRMHENGFKHPESAYADALKVMADVGLGELRRDRKGRIQGLYGVSATLQSIGDAVLGNRPALQGYAPRNRYSPIKATTDQVAEVAKPPKQINVERQLLEKASETMPPLVRQILLDESLPAEARIRAVRALLET